MMIVIMINRNHNNNNDNNHNDNNELLDEGVRHGLPTITTTITLLLVSLLLL